MEIRSDIYELLKTQEQSAKTKTQGPAGTSSFDALLLQAQEMTPAGQAISADEALNRAVLSGNMIDPADYVAKLDGKETDLEDGDASLVASITEQADTMLNSLDHYAKGLGTNASQREMWSMLEGMNGQIAGMRNGLESMSTPNAGLKSFVNDLEVLTATESFKMNRGDYQ